MSRLYVKVNSDSRKTQVTSTGNQHVNAVILWGSAGDSKKAVEVMVTWRVGAEKPQVRIIDYTEEE